MLGSLYQFIQRHYGLTNIALTKIIYNIIIQALILWHLKVEVHR